jgi:large subunit ribosomal protein L35
MLFCGVSDRTRGGFKEQDSGRIFLGKYQMPKQKTHKGLSKRIKVTASGKVKHKRTGGGHLMSGKDAKRRRRVSSTAVVTGPMAKKTKIKLCD